MRKTVIRFFTIADHEEEELWLRKKHNSGWRLVKATPPCFYVFEQCAPRDVIYRLDYKNSEQTEEYMQMVSDFGWEYFEQCAGWLYFRKPADEAESEEEGELFSDNRSRVDMVSHIVRTRLIPLAVIFLCCVIPNFVRAADGGFGAGGNFANTFFSVFFGVMFVIYVFLIVYCGIKLKRLRDKYRD